MNEATHTKASTPMTTPSLNGRIVALESSYTKRTKYVYIDSGIVPDPNGGATFDYTAPLDSLTFCGRKVRKTRHDSWIIGDTFTTISPAVIGYKTTISVVADTKASA